MDRLKLMLADESVVYQKAATFISYAIGSGLFVGDLMNYLNENAAGIGVMIGTATFLVNWRYQHKRSQIAK
jgi:hypothetical protein